MGDNDMELTVVRGLNYNLPSGMLLSLPLSVRNCIECTSCEIKNSGMLLSLPLSVRNCIECTSCEVQNLAMLAHPFKMPSTWHCVYVMLSLYDLVI